MWLSASNFHSRAIAIATLALSAWGSDSTQRNYPGPLTLSPGVAQDVDLAVGALDADGTCDAVSTTGEARLAVHLGTADGRLVAHDSIELPGPGDRVALGDVDGDGDLDVTCSVGTQLFVALGAGTGGFAPIVEIDSFVTARRLECGDVNGDGRDDLVVLFEGLPGVLTYLALESGTFARPIPSEFGVDARDFVLCDLDGDGALDVALADLGRKAVLLASGDGTGAFVPSGSISTDPVQPTRVLTAHLDTGPSIDLVIGSYWSGATYLYRNDGRGGFEGPQIVFGGNPMGAADWNSDGRDDLVAGFNSPKLSLSSGDGFQRSVGLALPWSCAATEACDVDGDGVLDLAFAARSYQTATTSEAWSSVGVLLGTGAGDFQGFVSTSLPTGTGTMSGAVLADVDGDGDDDLVTNVHLEGVLKVHRGNGRGGFAAPDILQCPTHLDEHRVLDHDGDGQPAVVAFSSVPAEVWLHESGPDGFRPPVVTSLSPFTKELVTGDWNGDGRVDLATTTWTGLVQVHFALDGGAFGPALASNVEIQSSYLPLITGCNLDGDGMADLFVSSAFDGLSCYRGAGDGTFTLTWELGGIQSYGGGSVADLNGDGLDDVALLEQLDHPAAKRFAVSVFFADGRGGLNGPFDHFVGHRANKLWTVDMDGDGHLDIAARLYMGEVSILFGNGRGEFDRARLHSTGPLMLQVGQIVSGGPSELLLDFTYDRETMVFAEPLGR